MNAWLPQASSITPRRPRGQEIARTIGLHQRESPASYRAFRRQVALDTPGLSSPTSPEPDAMPPEGDCSSREVRLVEGQLPSLW